MSEKRARRERIGGYVAPRQAKVGDTLAEQLADASTRAVWHHNADGTLQKQALGPSRRAIRRAEARLEVSES